MTLHIASSELAIQPSRDASDVADSNQATEKRGTGSRMRFMITAPGLLVAVAGAWYAWDYWTVGRFHTSTDDAYVAADNTTIAPRVSGYLTEVLVHDNEPVKVGQVLARIDQRDFRIAVKQARADVDTARADIDSQKAQLEIQAFAIQAAQAQLAIDEANQTFAAQEDRRYAQLAQSGYGSVQNAQQATAKIGAAKANVDRDFASLASAQKQTDLLKAAIAKSEATLERDLAILNQAELNLSYATIVSPVDGVVGNRTLRVGQFVQSGTQLMAIVPTDGTYVVANYKETQLTRVTPGQPVEIEVDTYPGAVAHGHVDSIAPATGQQFALLPPDNATGNFTKVVQRVPVRIILDAGDELSGKLRPGMSVVPTIDTKIMEARNGGETVPSAGVKPSVEIRRAKGRTASNDLLAE